jgi:hypothetical protein
VEEEQVLGQCGQQAPLQVTPLQVLQFVGQRQVQRVALQGVVAGRQQQHRAERPDQLRCVHLRAHPQPRRRTHAVRIGGQLQGLHQRLVLAGIGRASSARQRRHSPKVRRAISSTPDSHSAASATAHHATAGTSAAGIGIAASSCAEASGASG